jgi:hypothetical protein
VSLGYEFAGRLNALGSVRATRVLQEIAKQQFDEADRIASAMFAAYEAEIPAYASITDPALREDVQSVSAALVRSWLRVMSTGEQIGPEGLAPLLQGARRRAAQGIELQSMLRAYRVGIRVMWTELVSKPEWQSSALQGALVHVAEWALDFADRVNTEVTAVYLDEMERVAREREHRRSALLNVVLSGPGSEALDGPAELERPHAVVVARVTGDLDLSRLEEIGTLLETEVGAVLWTVRHRSVIAAVPYAPGANRQRLLAQLEAVMPVAGIAAFAVGGNARGARDSRQSYAEAIETLRAGTVLMPGQPVYDYQALAPSVALIARPEAARRFVATALEPLGTLVDKPWVAPTLETYLACQGRMKEAAGHLGVHLNTVKYRLRELREATGLPSATGDGAMALLLALKLRRLLEAEHQ